MLQTRRAAWENGGEGSDDGDAYDTHLFRLAIYMRNTRFLIRIT